MTSGLSGTYNSAVQGAEMVPEANVTHFDTKTLSAAAGWQVKAAAQAIKSGWMVEKALDLVKRIGECQRKHVHVERIEIPHQRRADQPYERGDRFSPEHQTHDRG